MPNFDADLTTDEYVNDSLIWGDDEDDWDDDEDDWDMTDAEADAHTLASV